MAKAWNFITKNQFIDCSYNDINSYPPNEWIINPDFSAVGGEFNPNPEIHRYWKQDSGNLRAVIEMDASEKLAIDVSELPNYKNKKKSKLKDDFLAYIESRYSINTRLLFSEIYSEATGTSFELLQSYRIWIKSVSEYYTIVANSINVAITKAKLDAISWNFSTMDTSDPKIDIQTLLT